MTIAIPWRGPWCSEVTFVPPDFDIADCVAASGLDSLNCATSGEFKVTAAAREAFRRDCGDTQGGMDLAHLNTGYGVHGFSGTYFGTLESIRDAPPAGWSLVILGWLDAVPKRYWCQRTGDVFHAMHWNNGDRPGFVHLANPLAPAGHPGWEVPTSLMLDFAKSATGRGGVRRGLYCLGLREALDQSSPEDPVTLPTINDETPRLVDLHIGDDLLDQTGKPFVPPLKVSVAQTQQSPWSMKSGGGTYYLVSVETGSVNTPALLHATTAANPRELKVKTQADVDAAVAAATAPLEATIQTQKATIADREDRLRRSSVITTL